MTQEEILKRQLSACNDWVPAFKLRGVSTPFGFLGHQADRRLRKMAEEGKIQRKIINGYVYYKIEPLPVRILKVEGIDKIIKLSY
jgi:hypothetical protein